MLGSQLLKALPTAIRRRTAEPFLEAAELPRREEPVRYLDVGRAAGLNTVNVWGGIHHKEYLLEAKGSGIAFFDYDNDGWIDIYLTNGTRLGVTWPAGKAPTTHLYKNNRDGTFTDVTRHAGLGRTGWQTGVCVGDYDNDGWDDIFLTFYGHNVLFHNNGDGTFTDVTQRAGLYQDEIRWGTGCTWLDYDRDGFLDLFVANYIAAELSRIPKAGESSFCRWKGIPVACGPLGLPAGINILYHNNGDGTFTDVSEKSGILKPGSRYSISATSYDFDNDGWPDIYVAVDSEASLLFHNKHDGTFEDIALSAGVAYSEDGEVQAGMGLGVADYDGDGWLDIYKGNFSDDNPDLYHNNGDGTFSDVAFDAGLGGNTEYVRWGCGFADFDNDGWPDIIQVNGHVYPEIESYHLDQTFKEPRLVYRNLGNGRFLDVSAEMGPGIRERFSSRGCAFGDYDNDGDVDAVVNNMNDYPSLLRNDGGNKNNWIKLKLIGTKCNRTAIGTRVWVGVGKHVQMDEVHSGTSVMSQSDLRLHFGLGQAPRVDFIQVRWPTTQQVETFTNLKPDQILTIREGHGIIKKAKPCT